MSPSRALLVAALLLVSACLAPDTDGACEEMCGQLNNQCGFEAFPDVDSCRSGCGYEAAQGGAVTLMRDCVSSADCDVFAILECQRTYGVE
jgi:hypothetical protein